MKIIPKEEIELRRNLSLDYNKKLNGVVKMMEEGKSEEEMAEMKVQVYEAGLKLNISETDYQKAYERYMKNKEWIAKRR